MKTRLTIDLFKVLTLTSLLGLSGCGGGSSGVDSTQNVEGSVDTTPPTLLLSQSFAPRVIDTNTTIVFTFSESMDTASLRLDGNLSSASNGGLWVQNNVVDDTLTIAPHADTNWSSGASYNVIINAKDLAGNPLTTLSFDFEIKSGAFIYVNAAMTDDTGDGLTPNAAHKFIHTAITDALAPATVLVAEGDYNVNYAASTHIVLKEGVSLYGGYNVSFSQRDSLKYITTIQEDSDGASSNFSKTIEGDGSDISVKTVIDGFNIDGNIYSTPPFYTYAIYLSNGASPSIQNNIISGGYSEYYSHGIYNSNSSPTIQNNVIDGGYTGGDSVGVRIGYSHGVYNSNSSSPTIQNNTIDGGHGGGYSYGVSNSDSSPEILNNIIDGGHAEGYSVGINNSYSSPTIQGNNISGGGNLGTYSTGVYNSYSSSLIQNNTIHGGYGWFTTYGIHNSNSSPSIQNNTIISGEGDNNYIIYDE